MNIIIDGIEYRGVEVNSMSLETEILKHAVEEGFEIADHLVVSPPSFSLTLNVFDYWEYNPASGVTELVSTREEQLEKLKQLWANVTPFPFECDFGSEQGIFKFDKMIVTSLVVDQENSTKTSFAVDLDIEQVWTISLLPATFQFIVDEDGKVVGIQPSETGATEIVLTVPEEVSETSWDGWYGVAAVAIIICLALCCFCWWGRIEKYTQHYMEMVTRN